MKKNIGIDIGGSCVKGVVIEGDRVLRKQTSPHYQENEDWKAVVMAMFQNLIGDYDKHEITVGLSAPGIADEHNRSIAFMPERLQGLEYFIWSEYFSCPTRVLNDAHAALWAEAQWGVAKKKKNVVMLTLGTGIGGGLLVDGRLHQGFLNRAGHLGHICIDVSDVKPSLAGITGSLEDAVGEAGLYRRSLGRFSSTVDLLEAHREGDTFATYVWITSVRKLALAIVSFTNSFSPELVVLAGGISQAGDQLLSPLRDFLEVYEWRPGGVSTPVVIAQYKDYAGAIGAALNGR